MKICKGTVYCDNGRPREVLCRHRTKTFIRKNSRDWPKNYLQEAADIGRISGISLEKLIGLLTIFYQEGGLTMNAILQVEN